MLSEALTYKHHVRFNLFDSFTGHNLFISIYPSYSLLPSIAVFGAETSKLEKRAQLDRRSQLDNQNPLRLASSTLPDPTQQ